MSALVFICVVIGFVVAGTALVGYIDRRIDLRKRSVIPRGLYCYRVTSWDETKEFPWPRETYRCPHWSKRADQPEQENGYCAYLGKGDWEIDGGLLWDQCKECGVNMGWEDYE